MTREERVDKFVHCASAAEHPWQHAKAMEVVEAIDGLEACADIATLMRLMA